jgi:23S rRNA (cytidine1920-2'-O)/16S rRNA (cytidine1409-2'-O)-methyltransferase
MGKFVSRAGAKLDHALAIFGVDIAGKICADLGSNTGGFVDCLLQRGAARVYAIDTGYGALEWKLRKDARVVVMERTNAMHATLPELVQFISIDVAWTRQRHILPAAAKMLAPDGIIVTLIKPHYEADRAALRDGILPDELVESVIQQVRAETESAGFIWLNQTASPIKGTGGNSEWLAMLQTAKQ